MAKKLLTVLLTLCMVASMVPVMLAAEVTGLSGSGTEADPWLIGTKEELIWFGAQVDKQLSDGSSQYAGKYFKLTADIDLAGVNWNPIGRMSGDHGSFKGTFDGDGHTIYNLNVSQNERGAGLFAYLSGNPEAPSSFPHIKNLTVHNATVKATNNSSYVGVVAGNAFCARFTNVHVTGTIDVSGYGYIGGIVGHGYVKVDNCSVKATGSIHSDFWCVGGILGYGGEGTTEITNCAVEGTGGPIVIESAAGAVGGILGYAASSGSQVCTGSDLAVDNLELKTFEGAFGTGYAENGLGYFFGSEGGNLNGTLEAENVEFEAANGNTNPPNSDAVASIGTKTYFDLQTAFDSANANDEVALRRESYKTTGTVTLTNTVVLTGENRTLDLGAYGLTATNGALLLLDGGVSVVSETALTGIDCVAPYSLTVSNNSDGDYVYATEAASVDTSVDVIDVTAANAQDVLDGKYGDINGKTINFTESVSEVLELARPTAYRGSNTTYYSNSAATTATPWSSDISTVMGNHSKYVRSLNGVTFTADDGVTLAGFSFSKGHNHQGGFDYVRNVATGGGVTYYDEGSLTNIRFVGLTITGNACFHNYSGNADDIVSDITFDGCKFLGTTDNGTSAAIHFLADNRYFKNITVKDTTIDGYFQGLYAQAVDGATVTDNEISNTEHNAIALQSYAVDAKGAITIVGNYIHDVNDRAIRFNNIANGATVNINHNIMLNCGDENGQLIKAGTSTGATVNLENNYWDGKDPATAVSALPVPTTVGVAAGNWDWDISAYLADGYAVSFRNGVWGVYDANKEPEVSIVASASAVTTGDCVDFGVVSYDIEVKSVKWTIKDANGTVISTANGSRVHSYNFNGAGTYTVIAEVEGIVHTANDKFTKTVTTTVTVSDDTAMNGWMITYAMHQHMTNNTFTVTFRDAEGNVISEQEVKYGRSAQVPVCGWDFEIPLGKVWLGWSDSGYTRVTGDVDVKLVIVDEADYKG